MPASYLLDTNILLRVVDAKSADHQTALDAVAKLLARGDECHITVQVPIEFWQSPRAPSLVTA